MPSQPSTCPNPLVLLPPQPSIPPHAPQTPHDATDIIKFISRSDNSIHIIHRPTAISHSPELHALFSHDDPDMGVPEYKVDSHIGSVAVKLLVEWMSTQDITLPSPEDVKRENETKARFRSRPGGMDYIALMNLEPNQEYVTGSDTDRIPGPKSELAVQNAIYCRYLCELWILAESLEMPKLQNQTMHKLEGIYSCYNSTEEESRGDYNQFEHRRPFLHRLLKPYNLCKYVFDHTYEDTPWLRNWFVWWFAFEDRNNDIDKYAKLYPVDMWVGMVRWLRSFALKVPPNHPYCKRDTEDFMIIDWEAEVPHAY